jgi:hypothetical protein
MEKQIFSKKWKWKKKKSNWGARNLEGRLFLRLWNSAILTTSAVLTPVSLRSRLILSLHQKQIFMPCHFFFTSQAWSWYFLGRQLTSQCWRDDFCKDWLIALCLPCASAATRPYTCQTNQGYGEGRQMHVQTNRMALELLSAIVHTPYYISISTVEENVSMRYRLALRAQSSQPNATLPRQLIPLANMRGSDSPIH